MKRAKRLFYTVIATCLWLLPAFAASAAGGGGAAPIVIVSDTRKLTGVLAWWGDLYNESHLYFTIMSVVLIPIVGCLFGFLADLIMGWIGIDLKKREIAEH